MRLAFYTYSYTDKLEMPLQPALEQIAATGYDGIDISGTHGPSADPASVTLQMRQQTLSLSQQLGLRVEGIITHATLTDSLGTATPLDLAGSVDLAVEVGGDVVVFHMGGAPEGDRQRLWDGVVEYLRRAADYAQQRGIRLAVDGVWPPWIVDSPQAFLDLQGAVGSAAFGINFDPCYLTLMGLDPVAVAGQLQGHLFHAHLKDYEGDYQEWTHFIPGQGGMDYPRVMAGLKAVGFDQAMAVECFTTMDFTEACRVGYDSMAAARG